MASIGALQKLVHELRNILEVKEIGDGVEIHVLQSIQQKQQHQVKQQNTLLNFDSLVTDKTNYVWFMWFST